MRNLYVVSQLELRKLEDQAREIYNEQAYQRKREERHRRTNGKRGSNGYSSCLVIAPLYRSDATHLCPWLSLRGRRAAAF